MRELLEEYCKVLENNLNTQAGLDNKVRLVLVITSTQTIVQIKVNEIPVFTEGYANREGVTGEEALNHCYKNILQQVFCTGVSLVAKDAIKTEPIIVEQVKTNPYSFK